MSKHQIGCAGARRLVVQPSKTTPGGVQIEILNADRVGLGIVTVDANAVGALVVALEFVAQEADKLRVDGLVGEGVGHE